MEDTSCDIWKQMEVLDVSERESFYWILLAQGKIQ
jgi:hypothetical protein